MKQSDFKRKLALMGAKFMEGSKHTRVYFNDRQCTMPRHPGHEIGEGLRRAILRQLGIE